MKRLGCAAIISRPFLRLLGPAHGQAALGAGDAHVHQAALFLQALQDALAHRAVGAARGVVVIAQLEGQHALGHAHQHHMRPLQPLAACRVDRVTTFWSCSRSLMVDSSNGLRHFQQAFLLAWCSRPRCRRSAATALAIQSQNSSTLVQRLAATFSLSSPSYRCFS
jgi:hypothetical protein